MSNSKYFTTLEANRLDQLFEGDCPFLFFCLSRWLRFLEVRQSNWNQFLRNNCDFSWDPHFRKELFFQRWHILGKDDCNKIKFRIKFFKKRISYEACRIVLGKKYSLSFYSHYAIWRRWDGFFLPELGLSVKIKPDRRPQSEVFVITAQIQFR